MGKTLCQKADDPEDFQQVDVHLNRVFFKQELL